jgi:amidophosphoribosyltransferase
MSDAIKHECGIALIRLLKPLEYYQEKYGTVTYGLNKLYLLMEKQHNRGQDGAGVANIKFDMPPGNKFMSRERSNASAPIKEIFNTINKEISEALQECPEDIPKTKYLKENSRFSGELFLGHLRYGTFGKNDIESCHPFIKTSNWISKNFMLAGNFNLTNVSELFNKLVSIGQHPKEKRDTITVLEKISHFLDVEISKLYTDLIKKDLNPQDISSKIGEKLNICNILRDACKYWDGGYTMAALFGHGDAFVARDPAGIRPAFYYKNDEIVVVTSERPVIQTAFNVPINEIHEIEPAHALIIKKDGTISQEQFTDKLPEKQCSFERIYFSRGTDADIYEERKMLGKYLAPIVLDALDHDLENTVFSYIPNTAETCFYGMNEEIRDYCNRVQKEMILDIGPKITKEEIDNIFSLTPRVEKIAIKDAKLRTFITDDAQRDELVAHVYDTTYGQIVPGKDTLVIIDDSIVRGTTLKQSILKILEKLDPKKIII